MNISEIVMIYSITKTTLAKSVSLVRDSANLAESAIILLCEYITLLNSVQNLILYNFNELANADREAALRTHITRKITECAEIEKRIVEETSLSLYTH